MSAPDTRNRAALALAQPLRVVGADDAVATLQDQALARFDARLEQRRQALRNDAVESVRHLGWLYTVRQGCSLPLSELVVEPMIYGASHQLRAHITALAEVLIARPGRRARAIEVASARWLEPIHVPAAARSFVIRRVWNEDAVSWARRFEQELLGAVDALHRDHFRPEFESRLDAIADELEAHA